MLENIEVLCHSSIKFNKGLIIYFDPFKINENYHDADIIFITHSHYDHYSEEDISKVIKDNTTIVVPKDLEDMVLQFGFAKEHIIVVSPNEEYSVLGINFKTIPAYNTNKNFHPKSNEWVGYIVNLDQTTYYIAGDTDITEENRQFKCDVAFVPIGGTYTMTYSEAAELINEIKPQIAVPIHYGLIVGNKEDANSFADLVDKEIECKILIR